MHIGMRKTAHKLPNVVSQTLIFLKNFILCLTSCINVIPNLPRSMAKSCQTKVRATERVGLCERET